MPATASAAANAFRGAGLIGQMVRMLPSGRIRNNQTSAWQLLFRGCLALVLATFAASAVRAQEAAPKNSIAVAVRSAVNSKLRPFYGPRGYWPLWVHDGAVGPEAARLIEMMENADLDGLDPKDYDLDDLRKVIERSKDGSPKALAKAEVELSQTFAAYVRDMRRAPSVKITYLDRELVPERLTEATVLRVAALAPSFSDYIDNAGWMSPIYMRLRNALAEYHDEWDSLPDVTISDGPVLKSGVKGDRVRLLRQRLGLPEGPAFDKAVATRVKSFQADHGLKADGIAGAMTIAAINRGSSHYEQLIRLNLERARVLPGPMTRHIVVDAAAARLWLYKDGEQQGTMRVIVGQPTQQTPMLAGMMRYATLNPYWNVPSDLVQNRIAPKVLDGQSFKGMNYEALSDWTANATILDPKKIDWKAVAAGQDLRVRQLPGRSNAMGRMKFMFPNDLGIYLHDTPDKALFDKPGRRFSSGCVRLEDAPALGKWLFGKALVAESDAPEQHIPLPEPVPVYLTYLTVAPTETNIAFIDDAYGRDEAPTAQFAARR